jgi:hypothetical protein
MPSFRSFPKHLKPLTGQGIVVCSLSGFLRRPDDIEMVYGQPRARDKADHYGAFGYIHPQDKPQPDIGGDPAPVDYGGLREAETKSEMGISDEEVRAAIRENRAPRRGF